ncbi:MAG: endonuclease/exonuclease/phosphatase family protein [Verrucomicrobiales bacterium]
MTRALATAFVLLALALSVRADVFATFNLRHENSGDAKQGDAWQDRAPVIANLIRFHGFDIVGTQEGLQGQMTDLQKLLPDHGLVSYGRDDGEQAGEQAGIFYRKSRYELQAQGRFWLSPTPEKVSKGWDAALPRLCTWAKFSTREEPATSFHVFNIHFDHRGAQARLESAKLLLARASQIAPDGPLLLIGDFNASQDSAPYRWLNDSARVSDAYLSAPIRHAPTGTLSRFDPHAHSPARIDHLFVSSDIEVERYGVLTDSYRRTTASPDSESDRNFPGEILFQESRAHLPSDHFPVVIHARFKKAED